MVKPQIDKCTSHDCMTPPDPPTPPKMETQPSGSSGMPAPGDDEAHATPGS